MGVTMPKRDSDDPDLDPMLSYEEEIIALEQETEQKVSQTMSAIESAVESWKAAGKKPENLRLTIVKLQRFYDELVKWEKKSLERRKEKDLDARITRLREFTEICARYQKENKKEAA